ncbi:N-acetylmuramoyl-L-alanine amidase [Dysgonomonas sp. 521]|uniref:N-acetylmuramoyl-L-alanine amidase n=1 Tax=Dysgonomonas sp. 521 TaxID=2302932 RepID=UPI0013D67085|nr:N-acetylmuramoyl-L-alanine amidase [Dysgonomonas sp. 521]NDV93534.1 N-acetylmuramoyl-L-alanine amidase [Dysgonomonas sp. 521]
MRKINNIILHCSATQEGQSFTVEDITRWHKARGFRTIGYHFVIYLDGTVHKGRDISEIGAHVAGHNAGSIGICYIGGLDANGNPKDTRTPEQIAAMAALISGLKAFLPDATIHGHYEFANKACPCFDVQKEYNDEKL